MQVIILTLIPILFLCAAAVLLVIRFAYGKYTRAKADGYIKKSAETVDPCYRGTYHFTPPIGWMNDPNGFIYKDGVYHLFYQYHPYSAEWGPMHWGHAVSRDLIRWEHLPVALAPDRPYDKKGCWSGSAIDVSGRLYLMYTGLDGFSRKTQNLAYSDDGVHFEKYAHNPVLRGETISARKNLRDPYLWKDGDFYYCLLADEAGPRLYRSENLTQWQLQAHVTPRVGENVFECPCLIRTGGADVLIGSPVRYPQRGDEFANYSANVYSVGALDCGSGVFTGSDFHELDRGTDFYAAQCTRGADGNVYLIAWMNMWERRQIPAELGHGWSGMMTLPRRLDIIDGKLIQRPVEALRSYCKNHVSVHEQFSGERAFDGVCGRSIALHIRCDLKSASRFTVKFFAGGPHYAAVTYDRAAQRFRFDVTHTRYPTARHPKESGIRQVSYQPHGNIIELELFLDCSGAELFLDGGKITASMLCYNGPDDSGIVFSADADAEISVEKSDIIVQ